MEDNIVDYRELLKTKEYDFLRENEHLKDNICLLTLGGSHAYGTNIPTSDIDIRGITLNSKKELFRLVPDFEQVVETNTDTTIYSLLKMSKLLLENNPNTIEILGCKPEHYLYLDEIGKILLENAHHFLSIIAIDKFGGYARAQYNRLEHGLLGNGHNDDKKLQMMKHSMECTLNAFNMKHKKNIIDLNLRIKEDSTNQLEDLLVTGSFKDYPVTELKTIVSEIHKVQSEYGNINKRNTKKTDLALAKHMMHLIRLYLMGTKLNRECVIQTYWDGKEHDMLMDIRNQKYMYEDGKRVRPEFYELLHDIQSEYEKSVLETILPEKPNYEALEAMYCDIYKRILV